MANAIRRQKLREAIADAIAENVKAYDVADVCVDLLGLEPPGEGEDPFYSKRVYVRGRLNKSITEVEAMARKIIDEYGDIVQNAITSSPRSTSAISPQAARHGSRTRSGTGLRSRRRSRPGSRRDPQQWLLALTREAFADNHLTGSFSADHVRTFYADHVRTPRMMIKDWYALIFPGDSEPLVRYMSRHLYQTLDAQGRLPWLLHLLEGRTRNVIEGKIRKLGGGPRDEHAWGHRVQGAVRLRQRARPRGTHRRRRVRKGTPGYGGRWT